MLHDAMARRLYRRAEAGGHIKLPAVPGMLDEYVKMCSTLFGAVGSPLSAEQLEQLRANLATELATAFEASPRSNIIVTYQKPVGQLLNYVIRGQWYSIEGAYENWLATRQPPLFGTEPDARVCALAADAADPRAYRVLDIGAGTGRNTLALARRGHPVDAVEMTPAFAADIRAEAERESLDVRVVVRDVLSAGDDLADDYSLILLSEVTSDFRTAGQLRDIFELAARRLAPGGQLVFNAFLTRDGYVDDGAGLELSQQCYSTFFTPDEMADAAAGLGLELVSDESVHDYEKAHLPDGAWPPTSWYAEWTRGQDVFDLDPEVCPISMRWLVYRRSGDLRSG